MRDRERERFNSLIAAHATSSRRSAGSDAAVAAAIERDRFAREQWENERESEICKLPHQLIAMACSNEHVILRWVDGSGIPICRLISWFTDSQKRIVSMDFHPSGEWLCCLTLDGTLYLIPVRWLIAINPGLGADGKINPSLAASDNPRLRNRPTHLHGLNVPSLYAMISNRVMATATDSDLAIPAPPPLTFPAVASAAAAASSSGSAAPPTPTSAGASSAITAPPAIPAPIPLHPNALPAVPITPRSNGAGGVTPPLSGLGIGTPPAGGIGSQSVSSIAGSVGAIPLLTASDLPFGALHDLTEIRAPATVKGSGSGGGAAVSHVVWWSSWSGHDYAIISSYDGDLTFVNLRPPYTRTVLKIKTAILKVEVLVHDDYRSSSDGGAGGADRGTTPPTTPKRASPGSAAPAPIAVRGSPLRSKPSPPTALGAAGQRPSGSSLVPATAADDDDSLDDGDRAQWKLALIHTLDGGVWTMLLESRINQPRPTAGSRVSLSIKPGGRLPPTHSYETCIEQASNKRFKPVQIKRFAPGARMSGQYLIGGSPASTSSSASHTHRNAVVGVHDPTRQRFELYSPLTIAETNSPPLRTFLVPTAKVYHYSEKFIFAVSVGREETTVTVVSTLLAQISPNALMPKNGNSFSSSRGARLSFALKREPDFGW